MTEVALGGVFTAGLLTFVSPCVLPIVPVYLGILAGGAEDGLKPSRIRPLLATVLFALGFSLVFSLIGLSATLVGRFLVTHKLLFQQVGGVLVLLLGLRFMGYLRIPWLDGGGGGGMFDRWKTRFHYLNAFVLGLVFALAWSPCIGSVLGAVLTYTSLKTTNAFEGMGYLATYSLGFAVPLLVLAIFAGPALAWLKRARRFLPVFEKITGGLLVATGFLLVTDRMGLLDAAFSQPAEPPVQLARAVAKQKAATTALAQAGTGKAGSPAVGATCAGGGDESGGACTDPGAAPKVPTMYEFFSPSCTICKQMIPTVMALQNECAGRAVKIELVDVTTETGKALARKYRVGGIPVFVFEDTGGKELARLVGYQPYSALQQSMAVLTGDQCKGYRPLDELR